MRRWLKPVVFVVALIPLGKIGYDAVLGSGLGADPIAEILNRLGFWTLTMLTITLACTPAKIALGITWPLRLRRMFGLFTFAYACLHFAVYVALDQFFAFDDIVADITKRKFIAVGFVALLLMVPLAITSTNRAVRRMGYVRWKRLHRLIYGVAALGVIHFLWRVKADRRTPERFLAILAFLMLVRAAGFLRERRRKRIIGGAAARRRPSGQQGGGSGPSAVSYTHLT
ncbi:MAG: protein-methionine-sulfoxide reductase heme-binding subunit MsrQ, partial [Candidatus Eisenbacteria bacterium]|nr:protein-methionine-sulfoxide reductase heme-binding subunit MsrQ [Candidatus Eisenbacteria bacterium]